MRPQIISATFCRMIDIPIAVMSGASLGAFRSGRYAIFSMLKAIAMQTTTATTSPAAMTSTDGIGRCAPSNAVMTDSETMAPIITTSPWAKLIRPMMP